MPDFVATLTAAAVFCLGLAALNALTRLAQGALFPDFAESSLLHCAGAVALARAAWKRAVRNQGGMAKES